MSFIFQSLVQCAFEYSAICTTAPSGPPENISVSAINSTSIDISWEPPARNLQNGYIVEYHVTVAETNTGSFVFSVITGTSLHLTSLHPYYIYACSVAAVTVGIGPYSDAIEITTDEAGELSSININFYAIVIMFITIFMNSFIIIVPSGAPTNFFANPNSPFSAYLFWWPPRAEDQNGVILSYTINMTEEGTEELTFYSSNLAIFINNLRPHVTYRCQIAAETSIGLGPFSSTISFRTHENGRYIVIMLVVQQKILRHKVFFLLHI